MSSASLHSSTGTNCRAEVTCILLQTTSQLKSIISSCGSFLRRVGVGSVGVPRDHHQAPGAIIFNDSIYSTE